MNELATKIQVVINTLEVMNIPSTFDNVNHLMGIYQYLADVRDQLAGMEEVPEDAGKTDSE